MTARVLGNAADDIKAHLAMVFHRFLDGEAFDGKRRLRLLLNGESVEPWDPYARDEEHTRQLPSQVIAYEDTDEKCISVDVHPFILPGQQLSQHLKHTAEPQGRVGGTGTRVSTSTDGSA